MKFLYHKVRDLREDNDLSQEDVAKLLGEHTTTYRRWETGETEIPVHILIELCKHYKVTLDYIVSN